MTSKSKKNGSKNPGEIVVPEPKRLSVGETEDGLVEIEIQLRKFHLWVAEANGFTRFKLSSLVTEILKDSPKPDTYEKRVRQNMITEVWAPLSICSRGEVPTREQFLKGLPNIDMAFWVETAKELGHEFDWLDGLNQIYLSHSQKQEKEAEEAKKKAKIPAESTPPS